MTAYVINGRAGQGWPYVSSARHVSFTLLPQHMALHNIIKSRTRGYMLGLYSVTTMNCLLSTNLMPEYVVYM